MFNLTSVIQLEEYVFYLGHSTYLSVLKASEFCREILYWHASTIKEKRTLID